MHQKKELQNTSLEIQAEIINELWQYLMISNLDKQYQDVITEAVAVAAERLSIRFVPIESIAKARQEAIDEFIKKKLCN